MKKKILFTVLMFSLLVVRAGDRIQFGMKVNKVPLKFSVSSFLAMPGDTLEIIFSGNSADQFVGQFKTGQLIEDSKLNWRFIVPEQSGRTELIILHNHPAEKMTLNIFVLTPASLQKGEYLNGYRIGNYPQKPFRDNKKYLPPKGFIEVTEANQDVYISNHFQLKQFLCKQQPDYWPKYVVIDPLLLTKLEMLIEKLHKKGIDADHLFIMSGYRTPFYNASINNGQYSRHIYGDAADVYVDENNDAVIDDLNKDGTASMADADVIYQTLETIEKDPEYNFLIGGMGKYKKTASHTWDVHVDTRGYRARW
jgi:uncharacterized protein YcbK (DUF882 family)